MPKLTVADIDVHGQRVLIRVDYNVPFDAQGFITDDTRIRASLPTVKHVLRQGGRAILMSHLGRPKGVTEGLRMQPVARRLSDLLGRRVLAASDCVGAEVVQQVNQMRDGECLLLENLRFHDEETANDEWFARGLAALGDVYVNDAFGTAHRAHASTEGVTRFIPLCVAGFLMQRELKYLSGAVVSPRRPFVVLLGGAKIADKIDVTRRLLDIADALLIGGGMAYTFLKSAGQTVGDSLIDASHLDFAAQMLTLAQARGKPLLLPTDHVIADRPAPDAQTRLADHIPPGWRGLDIGPETRSRFADVIKTSGTVLWNGPMGVFEMAPFAAGTAHIARAVAEATGHGTITIIGGGDTAAAVNALGLADRMSHVSTGGGASLELLEGRVLPGVAALKDKDQGSGVGSQ